MNVLKDFRKRSRYTTLEMADFLGVSFTMYEKIENGRRCMSSNFLKRFKKAFPDFDMNKFFAENKNKKQNKQD